MFVRLVYALSYEVGMHTPEYDNEETLNESRIRPIPDWLRARILFLNNPSINPSQKMPKYTVIKSGNNQPVFVSHWLSELTRCEDVS